MIPTTVIVKQGGHLAWHKRGCAHRHQRNVVEATDRDCELDFLRAIQREAKELNADSPIAPCLRGALR